MAVLGDAYLIAYIGGMPHLYIWRFGKTAPLPAGPGLGDYTLLPGSDLPTTAYNSNGPPTIHAHNGTLMGTEAALTDANQRVTKIYSGVNTGTPSSPLVTLASPSSQPTVGQLKAHFGGLVTIGGSTTTPTVVLGARPGGGTGTGAGKVQKVHAGGSAAAATIMAGGVAARKIYAGSTLVWEA